MKTLIAFYTRTGNNKKAATELKKVLKADLDEIVDLKRRNNLFFCALAALTKRTSKIKYEKDPLKYDLVVVASPLWAGNLPPATRTYLRNKFKKIAFVSICGMGCGNKNAVYHFQKAAKKPVAVLLVKEKEKPDYERFISKLNTIS